jgi:hypothetical protein
MMNTRCAAPFQALNAFAGSGGRVGATAMKMTAADVMIPATSDARDSRGEANLRL